MKKILAIFALIISGWNLNAAEAKTLVAGTEKELVEQVLNAMVNGNKLPVSSYIAPGYLKAYSVNASEYQLNTYSPTGFAIEKQPGNGVVVAKIWGQGKSWIHRLTFMVIKDAGTFYCVPGREPSEYMYIDSWMKVESNVTETTPSYTSPSGPETGKSRTLINDILYDMVNGTSFGTDARKYIAPSYYTKNRISKYDYQVNYYSPKSYEIISVNNDGTVIAEISGADKGWTHELTFKVVVENSQYYVMPGGHTDSKYIHPWASVRTDIAAGVKADEKLEIVTKLMDRMTYNKEGFGEDMILYIAPSYFKKYSIDPFSYQVNAYTPYGYSVTKNDGYGNITVKIWGDNHSWEQELVFKVVQENGLWYLMPGDHHVGTSYVDPWYISRPIE